jgi:iron-sulfur cluster assembly protein
MITVTETAETEINSVLAESKESYLRISVQGGGCSGFSYVFDFAKAKEEDDFEFGNVLIDSMSMQYLQGAKVDFVEDIMGSSFNIENPNAQTKCGCGSSFSV